jgi:hypothetical protein
MPPTFETRALMARVLAARGIADRAAFDGFPDLTIDPMPRTRSGVRSSLAGIFLPFRNLKELHR